MTQLKTMQMRHNIECRDDANYALLEKALKGVDLTEQETSTLAWLSTFEVSSIKNICSVIEKARLTDTVRVQLRSWESSAGETIVVCNAIRKYGRTWVRRDELPSLYIDLYQPLDWNGESLYVFEIIQHQDVYVLA